MIENKHCKVYSFSDIGTSAEGLANGTGGGIDVHKLAKHIEMDFKDVHARIEEIMNAQNGFEGNLNYIYMMLGFLSNLWVDNKIETDKSIADRHAAYMKVIEEKLNAHGPIEDDENDDTVIEETITIVPPEQPKDSPDV